MKAFPLQTLLELSHSNLDEAARKLGRLLANEQETEKTLALLERYREEYEERFRQAAHEGLSREQWGNYRAFLGRLDEAIAQQRALVAASKRRTADGQREWLDKRKRVKAFDTLSQRHRANAAHEAAKREQHLLDEHAAKSFRGKTD
jgi:flagellar FliJ protein